MKNQKIYSALLLMCCLSLFSMKCESDDIPTEADDGLIEDQIAPSITVLSPIEGLVFYTEGGVDSPDYIEIQATATDDSLIEKGSVRIFNNSSVEVDYYEETSGTVNSTSITAIQTSFRTFEPGEYTLEFEFIDSEGNSSFIVRNVICLFSVIDGSEN